MRKAKSDGLNAKLRSSAVALLIATGLTSSSVLAKDIDRTTSAREGEECSPCVLLLFLYDLNQQWHVIRAATYNSLAACKTEGARVNDDMKRVIDKKTQPSTNFYCLREEAKN
ncbi:MAG TPA: hypothetical protein VN920_05130 [Pyrinomonadaceae bacterium]|nr:hypothetical protein [Pyrinomonadaceae bacterium]